MPPQPETDDPTELLDLEAEEISAVDHAANGRRWLIVKKAGTGDGTGHRPVEKYNDHHDELGRFTLSQAAIDDNGVAQVLEQNVAAWIAMAERLKMSPQELALKAFHDQNQRDRKAIKELQRAVILDTRGIFEVEE